MKALLLDMYGVIIKESKGNFLPYTYSHFTTDRHELLTKLFRVDHLFTRAGNGEITSDAFFSQLGFADTAFHMRDYIENHLTLDEEFHDFAAACRSRYNLALLSNDVSEWSKHITAYHGLDPFFAVKIVSADVHCRKPDPRIYEIALERLNMPAEDCIFIDNDPKNLRAARCFGIDTILFNRDGMDYDGKIVYSFQDLTRLLQSIEESAN